MEVRREGGVEGGREERRMLLRREEEIARPKLGGWTMLRIGIK